MIPDDTAPVITATYVAIAGFRFRHRKVWGFKSPLVHEGFRDRARGFPETFPETARAAAALGCAS